MTGNEDTQAAEAIAAAHARHADLTRDIRKAHANPTPGALGKAFDIPAPDPRAGAAVLKRLGRELRPVVASDFLVLKLLDSPLLKQAQGAGPESAITAEEMAAMVWQFTTPIRTVREMAHRAGRAGVEEAATEAILDAVAPMELPAMFTTLLEHFAAAAATSLRHEEPPKEGEQRGNFPQTIPAPRTASGGGSVTSADSAGITGLLRTL
jgi:hypothetical protein